MNAIQPTPEQAALIRRALGTEEPLPELEPIPGGLTNHSFRFRFGGGEYLLRVPGPGTAEIIDRHHEAAVYAAIHDSTLTDDLIILDPDTGMKISRYWPQARNCNPADDGDATASMALLREFHSRRLHVGHTYSIFREIRNYQRLMTDPSEYADHAQVQARCIGMAPWLDRFRGEYILSHCDTVSDNFLFIPGPEGEELHLIDWEYSGEHDPLADISMFASYGSYDRARTDWLMERYFEGEPTLSERLRVYAYLALTGMMWSNWAEYKKQRGVVYEDYDAAAQYRYADEFSRLFWELLPPGEAGGLR